MNVTGDIVGTVIVAKTENEIDLSKWETKKAENGSQNVPGE